MASRASPFEFEHYPIEILKVNTLGVLVALGIAKKHRARLLFTSTSEVYGNPAIVPTPETYHGDVNPVGPRGCYDEAKRCGEAYVVAYRRQHGLDTRIARIFNTYGPRMAENDGRVVSNFMLQALRNQDITVFGQGRQTRSFCYVDDLIDGMIRMMENDQDFIGPVNLGNPVENTILEFAEKIVTITGSSSRIVFQPLPQDDPKQRRPDISLAEEKLGWCPQVALDTGLKRTADYFAARCAKG